MSTVWAAIERNSGSVCICYMPLKASVARWLPSSAQLAGKQPEVGVRYSSPAFNMGAAMQPMTNAIGTLWACGRYDAITGKMAN